MAQDASRSPRVCPVHGLALQSRSRHVAYGLPVPVPGHAEAERTLFPFGGEAPLGGCCVPPQPEVAVVLVCPRCVEARRTWWRTNARA